MDTNGGPLELLIVSGHPPVVFDYAEYKIAQIYIVNFFSDNRDVFPIILPFG